jgi:hypothetical protein
VLGKKKALRYVCRKRRASGTPWGEVTADPTYASGLDRVKAKVVIVY